MPEDDDDLSLDGEGGLQATTSSGEDTSTSIPSSYDKTDKSSRDTCSSCCCGWTLKIVCVVLYFNASNMCALILLSFISKILCDLDDWGGSDGEVDKFHDSAYSSKVFQKEEHRDMVLYTGAALAFLVLNLTNLYVICRQAGDSNRRMIKSAVAVFNCCQREQEARLKTRIPYRDVVAQIREQMPGISWPLLGALVLMGVVIPFCIIRPASFVQGFSLTSPGLPLLLMISAAAFFWIWKVGYLIKDSTEVDAISSTELELSSNAVVDERQQDNDILV